MCCTLLSLHSLTLQSFDGPYRPGWFLPTFQLLSLCFENALLASPRVVVFSNSTPWSSRSCFSHPLPQPIPVCCTLPDKKTTDDAAHITKMDKTSTRRTQEPASGRQGATGRCRKARRPEGAANMASQKRSKKATSAHVENTAHQQRKIAHVFVHETTRKHRKTLK